MNFNRKISQRGGVNATILANAKLICLGLLVFVATQDQVRGDLVNGGFEDPDTGPLPSVTFIDQSFVPGWQTDVASGQIEIWSNNVNGVAAYEGKQHVELNSLHTGTFFQEITGIGAGLKVGFEFAHRARVGTDVLSLIITDLGSDNVVGGGNDSILFSKNYSATAAGWGLHTSAGESAITTLGNNIRFAYVAVSTGSGDLTKGNFLDAAKFGVGVAVPEPSALTFLLGLAGLGMCLRRRKTVA